MIDIRLKSHWFTKKGFASAAELIKHYGCIQAQDTKRAKWCIGSRIAWSTVQDIDKALVEWLLVRTRPMRGTLHYMDPSIVRRMLKLCASKTLTWFVKRREYLWITDDDAAKALDLMQKALSGKKSLTRAQLREVRESWWLEVGKQRVYHLTCYAGTLGIICFWPPSEDWEDTFVLLEDRIAPVPTPAEQEQLTLLARMYFRGHGPATVDDFARWTGLGKTVSKKALSYIEDELEHTEVWDTSYYSIPSPGSADTWVRLLWGFDEYFISYKDRTIVADEPKQYFSVNGIFSPLIMSEGKIIAKRKREMKKDKVVIRVETDASFDKKTIQDEAQRFADFWWKKEVSIVE